jgi:uncharacterized protein
VGVKPGDHPDFYRLAPPPGASRESTLVLDRQGRFWHDGEPVDHPALAAALRSWIGVHPDDGRLILTNGYDWCYFRCEDAPFVVDALHVEGVEADGAVTLRLFDGSEEPLDPGTLSVGADGVVYARVAGAADRPGSAGARVRFDARFSRHAQTQLALILVSADPPTVRVQGHDVTLPPHAPRPR